VSVDLGALAARLTPALRAAIVQPNGAAPGAGGATF
jgi:hypothetical protein